MHLTKKKMHINMKDRHLYSQRRMVILIWHPKIDRHVGNMKHCVYFFISVNYTWFIIYIYHLYKKAKLTYYTIELIMNNCQWFYLFKTNCVILSYFISYEKRIAFFKENIALEKFFIIKAYRYFIRKKCLTFMRK